VYVVLGAYSPIGKSKNGVSVYKKQEIIALPGLLNLRQLLKNSKSNFFNSTVGFQINQVPAAQGNPTNQRCERNTNLDLTITV